MRRLPLLLSLAFCLISCGPEPKGEIPLLESAPLYEQPRLNAPILDTLPAGTVAALLDQKGEWTRVCLRGVKGWINISSLLIPSEPLPEGILAEKRPDSVLAEIIVDSEKNLYLRLSDLHPWFAPDTLLYAGFYEGMPGEPFSLLIINFAPGLAPVLRSAELDSEAMEMRESEVILTGEYYLSGNLLLPTETASERPFRRAEFVFHKGRRGLLVEAAPGIYKLLWRREIFS